MHFGITPLPQWDQNLTCVRFAKTLLCKLNSLSMNKMLCNCEATNAYLRNLISLELVWFLTFSLFVHLPNIFILDGKEDKSVWIFTEKWLIFGVKLGLSFVNWLLWSTMLKYKNIQPSLSFVLSRKYLFSRVSEEMAWRTLPLKGNFPLSFNLAPNTVAAGPDFVLLFVPLRRFAWSYKLQLHTSLI